MSQTATSANTTTLTTVTAATIINNASLSTIGNASSTTTINNLTTTSLAAANVSGFKTTLNVNASGTNYNLALPNTNSYTPWVLTNNGSGLIAWGPSPGPTQLVVYADKTASVTSNTQPTGSTPPSGSVLNIFGVQIGSTYLGPNGADGITTPYTNFTVPSSGIYSFMCNIVDDSSTQPSDGRALRITCTRSGTVVYDRLIGWTRSIAATSVCDATHYWNGFQTGDVCTFFISDNQASQSYPSSITDTSVNKHYGFLCITKLSAY